MNSFSNKEINISELPDYEAVKMNRISPKQLVKAIVQLIIFSLILGAAWGFLAYEWDRVFLETAIGIVALLFLTILFFLVVKKQKKYGYAIRERDIIYQRGYIFEKTTVIPFVRIQHVSTSRSFLEKMLGLAKLKVFTAGGSGSDISIPGLTPELAQQLKEKIANQVKDESY
jgi:hypothetical protein